MCKFQGGKTMEDVTKTDVLDKENLETAVDQDLKEEPKNEPKEELKDEPKEEPKGLSEEQVQKMLAQQRKVWEDEKKEEDRLSKLSAEEKEKELTKKQEAALARKETELKQKELRLQAVDILSEKKLPTSFKEFLVGADEEATRKNIDSFELAFREAVNIIVTERIKGKAPEKGSKMVAAFTKEAIEAMTPEDINKNWEAVQASLNQ